MGRACKSLKVRKALAPIDACFTPVCPGRTPALAWCPGSAQHSGRQSRQADRQRCVPQLCPRHCALARNKAGPKLTSLGWIWRAPFALGFVRAHRRDLHVRLQLRGRHHHHRQQGQHGPAVVRATPLRPNKTVWSCRIALLEGGGWPSALPAHHVGVWAGVDPPALPAARFIGHRPPAQSIRRQLLTRHLARACSLILFIHHTGTEELATDQRSK